MVSLVDIGENNALEQVISGSDCLAVQKVSPSAS